MNGSRWLLLIGGLLTGLAAAQSAANLPDQVLWVGRFDTALPGELPPPWRVVRLSENVPLTRYRLRQWDGVAAVEASAAASMALLARPLEANLARTPVLCWRWRIDAPLKRADLSRKSGDDYAARVYVAFRLPADELGFGLRAKLALARRLFGTDVPDAAINYVWDNRHPVGFEAANAYTDRARLLVAQSGAAAAGRWIEERHDVLADAARAFGSQRLRATLLAVASDTDNTGESAHAGFADLHFVARDQPCRFATAAASPPVP